MYNTPHTPHTPHTSNSPHAAEQLVAGRGHAKAIAQTPRRLGPISTPVLAEVGFIAAAALVAALIAGVNVF